MPEILKEKLASKLLCTSPIFRVYEEEILLTNDKQVKYSVVRKKGAVVIIPLNENEEVVLVDQYRHPTGRSMLELPAGGIEDDETDPAAACIRELQEEIGFKPTKLTLLNSSFPVPGYSDEYYYFYLAEGLVPSRLEADPDEFIDVVTLPFAVALNDARIREDGKSLLGLFLAQEHISKRSN